jgi:glycerol-1-phosphate dehydrogenase [NAD(P)+]
MDVSSGKHLMELPSVVLVGRHVLAEAGSLMKSQGMTGGVVVASGPHVWANLGEQMTASLEASSFESWWVEVKRPDMPSVEAVEEAVGRKGAKLVIGLGGGKSIDVAKLASFRRGALMISIPTSASHDGISSPFASIRGYGTAYSAVTKPPFAIIADIGVILGAPPRTFNGGVGDLLAKLTAVKDWQLAHEEKGEYYGTYAANLAKMSGAMVEEEAPNIGRRSEEGVRGLVEALISAGVAAGIAGSSRPCSGAEHLFSHALDRIAPGVGLHGEKTGLGAVMMARLHGLDWERMRKALKDANAPTTAAELGLSEGQVVEGILSAPAVRPDRYTILHKLKLNAAQAASLARETGVV